MPGYRSSRRTNYNTETMAPVDQRNKSKLVTVACLVGAAVIVGMINFSAEMVSVSTLCQQVAERPAYHLFGGYALQVI